MNLVTKGYVCEELCIKEIVDTKKDSINKKLERLVLYNVSKSN